MAPSPSCASGRGRRRARLDGPAGCRSSRLVGEAAVGDHVVCRARLAARGLVVAAVPEAEVFRVRRD